MGSHHARDEEGNDAGGPGAASHGSARDEVARDDVGPENTDHFGLFDPPSEAADTSKADDESDPAPHDADKAGRRGGHRATTGEIDLDELRDVLAGRSAPRSERDDEPEADEPGEPGNAQPRRRHRVRSVVLALVVVILIAGGLVVAGAWWWRQDHSAPTDWAGTGTHLTIVRVQPGDGLYQVGRTLVADGVVANAQTFVGVAQDDGRLASLAPGYYHVHEHSSSQSVVGELANPKNRLGRLRIIPGETLADTTVISSSGKKKTKPGIMSAIVKACYPTDGAKTCFSKDDLWKVATTASASDLGVVGWAVDAIKHAPNPRRRLEGLIAPGDYDVPPGSSAKEALSYVVSAAAAKWNGTDIVAEAKARDTTPYKIVTVASLVQAEGIGSDMPKVARVIYNRLAINKKLEFDSTVNYGLNRAQIATSNDERLDQSNPYSTYAHHGLTPTPIGSPGPKAVAAAGNPADGDWLYFVAVDKQGHTCFSETAEEHEKCVDKARANGVFG